MDGARPVVCNSYVVKSGFRANFMNRNAIEEREKPDWGRRSTPRHTIVVDKFINHWRLVALGVDFRTEREAAFCGDFPIVDDPS